MRYPLIINLTLLAATLCACNGHDPAADETAAPQPRTAVTLTTPTRGTIEQSTELTATSTFLTKTTLTAPFAAYVSESRVRPGMQVRRGQLLYRLQSKEQHALESGQTVELRAERDGIVTDVAAQSGDYATEGQALCLLADAGSMVFEVSVPYELHSRLAHSGHVTIELPDGNRYPATLDVPLATMDAASQTERVVARAKVPFLPEGMRAKALLAAAPRSAALLLPREAVQSDEALTEHWVMKFREQDSTAVRVDVTLGESDTRHIEIVGSALTPSDRIILAGAYGLEDGAKVRVVSPDNDTTNE